MSAKRRDGLLHRALNGLFNRYPRVVYIHLPKSAGTSAVEAISRAMFLPPMKATRAYARIDLRASNAAERILDVEMMKAREVVLIDRLSDPLARFVYGHVYAHPRTVEEFSAWNFITLLREPRERFLSNYLYNRFKSSEWLPIRSEFPDYLLTERARMSGAIMARYFSGLSWDEIERDPDVALEASLANLANFASVGFMDRLDEWLGTLEPVLGRRPAMRHENKNPRPELYNEIEASAELSSAVDALCALDKRIYDTARGRFANKKPSPRGEG